MVVRPFGLASGRRVERRWTLIASKSCGPEIPALAAPILLDMIVAGAIPAGARDAGTLLTLAQFEPAFARMPIRHERVEVGQASREWEEDGQFWFDVPISAPFAGLIVHYKGWLRSIEM